MVNYDVCCDDSHDYWSASIGDIKKGVYFVADDGKILSDMDNIKDYFSAPFGDRYDEMSKEEFDKLVEEEIKKEDIKEVIYVYIETPEII